MRIFTLIIATLLLAGCGGPSDEDSRQFGLGMAVIIAADQGTSESSPSELQEAAAKIVVVLREHACVKIEDDETTYRELAELQADRLADTTGGSAAESELRAVLRSTKAC